MGAIDRYIFRQAALAFLGGLVLLTLVVWITQVLRQVDLVTNNGQTVLTFFYASSLVIPMLLALLAPIALFVAVVQVLGKLSGDSELIVIAAAGLSPRRLMKPFLVLSVLVALFVGALTLYIAPAANRELRELWSRIAANVLTVIAQPGQFSSLRQGLTFHIRDRSPGGILRGILVIDGRDSRIHTTYVAERGMIAELPQGSFFVLEEGNLQRKEAGGDETTIITFDRYALDLSEFSKQGETSFKPQERHLSELLMAQDPNDVWTRNQPGAYRQELYDRLAAPLYPIAMMCIAFALLGQARTTRQGRALATLGAIGAMALVRGLGFAVSAMTGKTPALAPLIMAVPMTAILIYGAAAIGLFNIAPERLINAVAAWGDNVATVMMRHLRRLGALS